MGGFRSESWAPSNRNGWATSSESALTVARRLLLVLRIDAEAVGIEFWNGARRHSPASLFGGLSDGVQPVHADRRHGDDHADYRR